MKIEIINPLNFTGWDELILTQPNTNFFHSTHWARVLNNSYGYTPLYFTVRDNDKLLALFPIMEIDSFLTGKRGISLPFTDFCQPIIRKNVNVGEIWNTIREYGKNAGWNHIEIRGGTDLNHNLSLSSWYYEHDLDLSQGAQHVHDHFRNSHKRNIRKAQKSEVKITICNSFESIKDFYRLNLITRKMHGLPPQPFSFFKNIHQFIIKKNHGILLIAHHRGKAIAGALCFHFSNKAMYKFAASDKKYLHLRPNNLVIWKAIEWYCQQGYISFNFGRTDRDHKGLRWFKSGWGPEEKKINYYRHNLTKNHFYHLSSTANGWHTSIFKQLPISFLKMFGSVLYRHIG